MDDASLIQKELKDIDIYRNTPIRGLGYTDEIGEAFRGIVHVTWVRLSYVISFGYVFTDVLDKSRKANKLSYPTSNERQRKVTTTAVDALVWQGLASVVIPCFTINRICATSNAILRRTALGTPLTKVISTIIGLSSIPIISHPVDSFVEHTMEKIVRPYYSKPI